MTEYLQIFAGIVLLLLVLVIVILFIPMGYKLHVNAIGEKTVLFHAGWLGKLFRVHVEWHQGWPLFKQVYAGGSLQVGEKESVEEWRKKQTERAQEEKLKEEAERLAIEAEKEARELRRKGQDAMTNARETAEEVIAAGKEKLQEAKVKIEDTVQKVKEQKEPITDKMKGKIEDMKAKSKSKEAKAESDGDKKTVKEKLWFVPYVVKKDFLLEVWTLLKRIYGHTKPRNFYAAGVVGTGDPGYTAMLAAGLYSVWPELAVRIGFEYVEECYDGQFELSGKIFPAVMIWFVLLFALSSPVRPIIWKALRGGK